jgi:hypothetical protein
MAFPGNGTEKSRLGAAKQLGHKAEAVEEALDTRRVQA